MEKKSNYIDVDRIVVEPSPLRIRNILTLEERVRAIEAYNSRPMYTKVARIFKCSWQQIRNIITNRDAIIQFYEASKIADNAVDPNLNAIQESKISFLDECLHEYIQRAKLCTDSEFPDDFLCKKALEFRDLIEIDNFTPNKAWLKNFVASHNFSSSNRILLSPASTNLKDIMIYCSKYKFKIKKKKLVRSGESPEKTKLIKRKIIFLEKALLEYIQRIQYHPKTSLNDDLLLKTAVSFRNLLKIDNFVPNRIWCDNFKEKYNTNLAKKINKTEVKIDITLDLLDILSYCNRLDRNEQLYNLNSFTSGNSSGHTKSDFYATDCNDDNNVIIKDSDDTINSRDGYYEPSLKRIKIDTACSSNTNSLKWLEKEQLFNRIQNYKDALKYLQPIEEFIMLQENYRAISLITQLEEIFKNKSMYDNTKHHIQSLKRKRVIGSQSNMNSCERIQDEELSEEVMNYTDALKYLQPIEEFIMLQENYRAISLITQLEQIFKNPLEYDNASDYSETSSN